MDLGQILETTVSGLGYELVEWERPGQGGLLRIFVDKVGGIKVEDCAHISQHLSQVLAVEGVNYGRLEISSPGLDRVLRKERDFLRFIGEQARIKVRVALDGQRNFKGTLHAVHDGKLELETDGRVLVFELDNLETARLIPNI